MTLSSQEMTKYLLVAAAFSLSVLGWASVDTLIGRSTSDWATAIGAFSLVAIVFLCASLIFRERKSRAILVFSVFLPSLFFSPSLAHLAFVFFSGFMLFRGMGKVEEDMNLRLKLSLKKSMGAGVFAFSFSIALLIASAYYTHIRFSSWEDLVPRFTLAQGSGDALLWAMGTVYPELGKIRKDGMTVDSFLHGMIASKKAADEGPVFTPLSPNGGMPEDELLLSKEAELSLGRLQMSRLAGRAVSGDEKVSDVLGEAFRHKIVALVSGDKAKEDLPAGVFPFFLSLLLFVTVLSLSSLLQWVWISGAALFMGLLIRSGVFSVERIQTEREVLR